MSQCVKRAPMEWSHWFQTQKGWIFCCMFYSVMSWCHGSSKVWLKSGFLILELLVKSKLCFFVYSFAECVVQMQLQSQRALYFSSAVLCLSLVSISMAILTFQMWGKGGTNLQAIKTEKKLCSLPSKFVMGQKMPSKCTGFHFFLFLLWYTIISLPSITQKLEGLSGGNV